MDLKLHISDHTGIAEFLSESILLAEVQDALDMMADCGYNGADAMILRKEQIRDAFFDLKTGLAGEVLQKFSNYQFRLAIVGDFSEITSKSLRDFIYESNKQGRILFVNSREQAIKKLSHSGKK